MCKKTFKIKTNFFQTIQFFEGILYNILLLFGELFIYGGLMPPPKWSIALASPRWCWLRFTVEEHGGFTPFRSVSLKREKIDFQ